MRFQRRAIIAALVLVMAAAITGGTLFLSGDGEPCAPSTPGAPATAKIAFASNRDGNYEIYVMNADGSGQTRLTNLPRAPREAIPLDSPAWSPDGSRIAFVSESNEAAIGGIHVMNADGSCQTKLIDTAHNPAWSPDGSRIAFGSFHDFNYELYWMNADGSGQTRLLDVGEQSHFAWSPDGKRIAFATDRYSCPGTRPCDRNNEIHVMNADGSGLRRLTDNPASDHQPAWSPDGSRSAFSTFRDDPIAGEIYVMNADGSSPTRLTDNPANDFNPAWSPDGSRIAFSSDRDGNYELYWMNADGSGQTRLTDNPADDRLPAWSPAP